MLTEFFLSDTVLGAADKIVNTHKTLAPLVPFPARMPYYLQENIHIPYQGTISHC